MVNSFFLIEIFKYSLPGTIVLFAGWLLFKKHFNFLDYIERLDLMKIKIEHAKSILPLRLQAYERAILFLERINPTNMLIRLHSPELTALGMQQLLLSEIRAEFQHNITQQLYMTPHAWAIVKRIMNDTVSMINQVTANLPHDASSLNLNKTILNHLENLETENPYDTALTVIKQDIQQLF